MSRAERSPSSDEVEAVALFLRGRNLEQLGRVDDAIAAYEGAVTARFDASGPYDRLLEIYGARAEHAEVVRVASAALDMVKTYEAKRAWYSQVRDEAQRASAAVPPASPRSGR